MYKRNNNLCCRTKWFFVKISPIFPHIDNHKAFNNNKFLKNLHISKVNKPKYKIFITASTSLKQQKKKDMY